jgi:hypothetical protein
MMIKIPVNVSRLLGSSLSRMWCEVKYEDLKSFLGEKAEILIHAKKSPNFNLTKWNFETCRKINTNHN